MNRRNRWTRLAAVMTLSSVMASLQAQPSSKPQGWQANPKIVAAYEASKRPGMAREDKVPKYTLPDPLQCADGTRVTTATDWEAKRRPETLDFFAKLIYGRTPPVKATGFEVTRTDPTAMDGKATLKQVKITSSDDAGKSFGFHASVLIPNGVSGPVPAFVLINHRSIPSADPTRATKDGFWPAEDIIARGYAAAVFQASEVDPDKKEPEARASGVRGVWPAGGGTVDVDAWGTLGAWAWGASRVLDYLLTDPAIDGTKIGVVGHSRGGKTALWAAAQDQRFAIGVSNCSGRGGASLTRRGFGEPWYRITQGFPHWFCGSYNRASTTNMYDLPIDHHQLIALMAPRAVYVASADEDLWADPRGEFLSLVHAGPVYRLYGLPVLSDDEMPPLDTPVIRGRLGYHIRSGVHNLTPYDWARFMDFADRQYGR